MKPCVIPSRIAKNDNELRSVLESAGGNERVGVQPGNYAGLTLKRPVQLVGVDENGSCSTLKSETRPTFESVVVLKAAAGTILRGIGIGKGGFHAKGKSEFLDGVIEGADIGVFAHRSVTMKRFVVRDCGMGIVLNHPSTLINGLIANNKADGILANYPVTGIYLTVTGNGGNGIHLVDKDSVVHNAIIATNGGWGIFEENWAQILEHVTFARNGKGQYGGFHENTNQPELRRKDRVVSESALNQGDRQGMGPAMAVNAAIRTSILPSVPWSSRHPKGGPIAKFIESYRPYDSVQPARDSFYDVDLDILGNPRIPGRSPERSKYENPLLRRKTTVRKGWVIRIGNRTPRLAFPLHPGSDRCDLGR